MAKSGVPFEEPGEAVMMTKDTMPVNRRLFRNPMLLFSAESIGAQATSLTSLWGGGRRFRRGLGRLWGLGVYKVGYQSRIFPGAGYPTWYDSRPLTNFLSGKSDQNSFKLAIALSEDVRSLVAFLELLPRSFVIHT
jgi:hypothetical protein